MGLYVSLIAATVGYIILITGILFRNQTSNFATWVLWEILDIIVLIGTIKSGGDATLVWCFTIGTGITALCLLYKKQIEWTKKETYTAILTFVCIMISLFAPTTISIIAGSIAVFIAGTPYFKFLRLNKLPKDTKVANTLFLVCSLASLLTVINAHGALIGLMFPAVCVLYWTIAGILTFRNN